MTLFRSVFHVVVRVLAALIVAAVVPAAVSADSCRLRDDGVHEGKPFVPEGEGSLSLADLKGVTWRLARLGRNERVPEGVKVTAVFGDGRVSGSGGCNRYSAGVVETGPLEFSIGPAASTKMACPDPAGGFEDRYLSALQAANRFGFLLGNLVLHYRKEDSLETMTFER